MTTYHPFPYSPPRICQEIADFLRTQDSFFLTPHTHIDGDDAGCMLALALALEQLGKEVYLFSDGEVPSTFSFLKGYDKFTTLIPNKTFDVVLLMECPKVDRLPEGIVPHELGRATINLDHHIGNEQNCTYNWVDSSMSALGEMVYYVIMALDVVFTNEIAEAVYTSILSDSGSFRHSNVTSRTHSIAAHLVSILGPRIGSIAKKLFSSHSLEHIRLLNMVQQTIELSHGGTVCTALLTKEMLEKTGIAESDTQEIIAEVNCIAGTQAFALLKDTNPDYTRVSLRSEGPAVNTIAQKFGGGGHRQAAACKLAGIQLAEARKTITDELIELIDEETSSAR